MKIMTANLIYPYQAELGEGALWDERISRLWWVDITNGRLHRFDPKTKVNETFEIGSPVGTVVPEEGRDVVLAIKDGFASYDTKTEKLEMLATVEHANQSVRFNDGKCDPAGRFWAGTLAQDGTVDAGDLYCLESNLTLTVKIKDVGISNGLGWNLLGDKMYYVDSLSQKVVEFSYNLKDGVITNPRTVVVFKANEGTPDGMCVDSEGMLWVALWDGSKVVRLNPENGEYLCEVHVPCVHKVTSCTLGGENLSTLFITTARQGFTSEDEKNQPDAGSLFAAEVGVRGLTANLFKRS